MRIKKDEYRTVDALYQFLGSEGYTGTLNDRMIAWLKATGYSGSLTDALYQYTNNPLPSFSVTKTAQETDLTSTATTTPRTFSNVALGDANADRVIYVSYATVASSDTVNNFPGMTIGGVSATNLVEGGFSSYLGGLFKASVPAGTTGDIVFDYNQGAADKAFRELAICVYSVIGGTDNDTTYQQGNLAALTLDCDVAAGDAAIGLAFGSNIAGGWSWSGLTETDEVDLLSDEWASFAHATDLTAATPRTITATCADGVNAVSGFSWSISPA